MKRRRKPRHHSPTIEQARQAMHELDDKISALEREVTTALAEQQASKEQEDGMSSDPPR